MFSRIWNALTPSFLQKQNDSNDQDNDDSDEEFHDSFTMLDDEISVKRKLFDTKNMNASVSTTPQLVGISQTGSQTSHTSNTQQAQVNTTQSHYGPLPGGIPPPGGISGGMSPPQSQTQVQNQGLPNTQGIMNAQSMPNSVPPQYPAQYQSMYGYTPPPCGMPQPWYGMQPYVTPYQMPMNAIQVYPQTQSFPMSPMYIPVYPPSQNLIGQSPGGNGGYIPASSNSDWSVTWWL